MLVLKARSTRGMMKVFCGFWDKMQTTGYDSMILGYV
jgi:hypothetical protein